ncbi:hypothetical protein COCON_G00126570 [Conger conger]|uniref:C2H2-type domain-containing protein n=1 Tax=Conger conger TaxID=82655 RepID=A0A9Q1DDW7_CONCO|nr:hypothetical protein COCON_G00126570 [Conger conger]
MEEEADPNLIMECEEEELEPWQQVNGDVQEEEVAVAMETETTADSCAAVAAVPGSLAVALTAGPIAALPEPVSTAAGAAVTSGSPIREGEEASADTPSSPPALPLTAIEAMRTLVSPAAPQPKPAQQLVLTQSPSPLGAVPLSQVLHTQPGAPGNLAGQPILIATQVQTAVAGQNTLNPVGFLLNGQAFTFLTAAGTQLFKPVIAQALSQPTNHQPATTEAHQQLATMATNQQPVTVVVSQQPSTAATNQLPATMVADQQSETTEANTQLATMVANQQPVTVVTSEEMVATMTNQHLKSFTVQVPATLTIRGSTPLSAAMPSSSRAIPGTLQTPADKQRFNPEVKKLIQPVNEASPSVTAPVNSPKVSTPTTGPRAKVKVLLPRPAAGSKMCPQCGAQYRVVETLRGLLCLCSPEITRGLQVIGAAGASNLSPAASKAPAPQAGAQKPAAPRLAATACVSLSPSRAPSSGPDAPDAGPPDPGPPGKLIMLVDDFYYGRAEGCAAPERGDAGQQGALQFRCLRCDKKLKSNVRLMNHLRHHVELEQQSGEVDTHSSCQHCYRHFPTPFRLQCHLETVHSQYESTTKCKICEWAFESEPVFLQHMKNTHSAGEMPYVCQVCDFRSSMYSDVFSHFRTCHKDTASLLCPYCLKVFKNNSNYQHHYHRHQRKSVLHCDKCRLQFLSSRDKLEHKLGQHKSFRKPRQLNGLKAGTKVTIRAYAVEQRTVGIVKMSQARATAAKPEPTDRPLSGLATPSPAKRQPIGKRKPMCSMQELLTKFQEERVAMGKQSCLECTFDVPDFPSHFPTYVNCTLCHYCTCCSRAYANHMINNHVSRKTSTKYLALYKAGPRWSELTCTGCSFTTQVGDQMARHLAKNPDHGSSYCTLRGPPAQGQRAQSRGNTAALAVLGPDVGQAVRALPVSSRVLPSPSRRPPPRRGVARGGLEPGGRGGRRGGDAGNRGRRAAPGGHTAADPAVRALLRGPRAAQRFHSSPEAIWTWLLELERGLERERGLEPGVGPGLGRG